MRGRRPGVGGAATLGDKWETLAALPVPRRTRACRDELNSYPLGFEDGFLDEIGWSYPGGENPSKGNGEPPAQ